VNINENRTQTLYNYDKVKDLYSPLGAPSIDPVVLIKIVLIQYLFGIPSMRQTIREIEVNVAYRWFLGYSLTEKIPHFSTFNKNYERRFKNTDLFESIFKEILAELAARGKTIFYSSHIMEVVEKISSRIILLNNGEIVADGTFQELKERNLDASLEEIFNQLTGFHQHKSIADEFVSVLQGV